MARETSVDTYSDRLPDGRRGETVRRRSYLKLVGSTAVAAAGMAGTAAGEESYEVIEATGQSIHVGDGETFENVLIDMRGGGDVSIRCDGEDWTVRNVGVRGRMADGASARSLIMANANGDCLIENVHYTGGAERDGQLGFKFVFVPTGATGTLTIRNCNWQNVTSTAAYLEPGGREAPRADVVVENCYAASNRIESLRTAGPNDVVRDCVFEKREDGEHNQHRLVRAVGGGVTYENCHFDSNGLGGGSVVAGPSATVELVDCEWDERGRGNGTISTRNTGTNPRSFLPDGVPTSPEEAASGGSGDSVNGGSTGGPEEEPTDADDEPADDDSDDEDESADEPDGTPIRLEGTAEYVIEVSGEIEPAPEIARWVEEGEQYGDGRVEWYLTDSWTEWYFTGELEAVELENEADLTVYVDGEAVDPQTLPPTDDDPERRLRMEGAADYVIEAGEGIRPAESIARWVDEGEQYGDGRADWYLTGSWTEWLLSGGLEALTLEVDDQLEVTVEPGSGGSAGDERRLRMDGTGEYVIEASGSIRPAESIARWVEEGEQYGDGRADWYLTGSWTEWVFTGELERLEIAEAADLTVELE